MRVGTGGTRAAILTDTASACRASGTSSAGRAYQACSATTPEPSLASHRIDRLLCVESDPPLTADPVGTEARYPVREKHFDARCGAKARSALYSYVKAKLKCQISFCGFSQVGQEFALACETAYDPPAFDQYGQRFVLQEIEQFAFLIGLLAMSLQDPAPLHGRLLGGPRSSRPTS